MDDLHRTAWRGLAVFFVALYVNDIEIAVECIKLFELDLAALPKLTP